jgi:molecular chaperone DnaK
VKVSAKDLGTGKTQAIQVTASSGLTEAEVQRLLSEAEQNATADQVRRQFAELKNQGDGLIYSTERTLAEFAEQVLAEDRTALEAALARTRLAVSGSDLAVLKAAVDDLSALSYKMTERLYATLGGETSN